MHKLTSTAPLAPSATKGNDHSKKAKNKKAEGRNRVGDKFGRTGQTQVLHVDLFYSDGTKGEINVTSPHIAWGEDSEIQWYHIRNYIKSQYEQLGIVRYHAHRYCIDSAGVITKSWSWFPFDLIENKEVSHV